MAVTIRDIAKHAGVSVSTVSRVINKKPDVKQETYNRVTQAIENFGYTPNSVARGLVLKRSNVIGFIVPDITSPSFPELARGIVIRARSLGYSVMFFDTDHDSHIEKETINIMQGRQVDGIILSFDDANRDELEKLKKEHFPVVQIYRKSSHSRISTIALDNVEAGAMATRHLMKNGHRQIGLITTGKQSQSGYERQKGYCKALQEAGISIRDEFIQTGDNSIESGKACMSSLLSLETPPSAIFVCHDTMAIGAYDAIYEEGLSVPEDISIISHDNIDSSRFLRPKLTTIDTHKSELGSAGVDLLVEAIHSAEPLSREVIFQSELIERDSVRKIR